MATGLYGVPAAARLGDPDPIAVVEQLIRSADFDAAEARAREVLASGTLTRHDVARAYLEIGIAARALHNVAAAEEAFRRALVLEIDLQLPPSAGPHVVRDFAHVNALVSAAPPLAVTVKIAQRSGGQGPGDGPEDGAKDVLDVAARVTGDDGGTGRIVRRIRLRGGSIDVERALDDGGRLDLALPLPAALSACTEVIAAALDEHGNEIVPAAGRATLCPPPAPASTPAALPSPAPVVVPSPAPPPRASVAALDGAAPLTDVAVRRPIPGYVWATAAAAATAGVVTAVLGTIALSRRSDYQDLLKRHPDGSDPSTEPLYETALTAEHRATIAGVVTTAFGVTALVMYFARPRRAAGARAARLEIGPGTLVVGSSF
jgi:hypothetical protein